MISMVEEAVLNMKSEYLTKAFLIRVRVVQSQKKGRSGSFSRSLCASHYFLFLHCIHSVPSF